jgi:hypothetical protein
VRFGFPGSADIFAILPPNGQFLAIECKTKTGKLSPGQELYLEAVFRAGGEALVIRDADELSDYLFKRGV